MLKQQQEQQQSSAAAKNGRRKVMHETTVLLQEQEQLQGSNASPPPPPPVGVTHVRVYAETLSKDVPLVRRGERSAPFLVANDLYTWSPRYIETLPPEVVKRVALEEALWRAKARPRLSEVTRVVITPSA